MEKLTDTLLIIIKYIPILLKVYKVISKGFLINRNNKSYIICQNMINGKFMLYIDGVLWGKYDTYDECWHNMLFDEFLDNYENK